MEEESVPFLFLTLPDEPNYLHTTPCFWCMERLPALTPLGILILILISIVIGISGGVFLGVFLNLGFVLSFIPITTHTIDIISHHSFFSGFLFPALSRSSALG